MAVIRINLTDNFTGFINKTNDISNTVGDVANLVTGDSNVVDALNSVKALFSDFDDSDSIKKIARSSIAVIDNGGTGSMSYDSANGQIFYTGPSTADVRSVFGAGTGLTLSDGVYSLTPNAITNDLIATNTLTSDRFNSRITFAIKDSDGSTLKTVYSPGS
jgi:hypothetical protein